MAFIRLTANVGSGTGPFTFTFAPTGTDCTITFKNPATGEESEGSIVVDTPNNVVEVEAHFETEAFLSTPACEDETFNFTVTVEDADGCEKIASLTQSNPCLDVEVNSNTYPVQNGEQRVEALVSGSNGSLSYQWEKVSGDATIVSGDQNQIVTVSRRQDLGTSVIKVTITDANGCEASKQISLASVGSRPVLTNYVYNADCDDKYAAVTVDLTELAFDADGDIDWSTAQITTDVPNGTTSLNTAARTLTYTPNDPNSLLELLFWTVADSNGNESFKGTMIFNIDDCLSAPTTVADTASTDCETAVEVDVLANDSDSDGDLQPDTLEVLAVSNGTAIVTSDNNIRFVPDDDFEGDAVVFYGIKDNDENWEQGKLTITVGPCCDNHSKALSIVCSDIAGDDIRFTASEEGTASGEDTTTVEVQLVTNESGGGFSTASTIDVTLGGCSGSTSTNYTNEDDGYTDASGDMSGATGTGGTCDITPLSTNSFLLEFTFGDLIPAGMAAELAAFINDCDGEVFEIQNTDTEEPYKFLADNISNVIAGPEKIAFHYVVQGDDHYCASTIDTYVQATHNYLLALAAGTTTVATYEIEKFKCIKYGDDLEVQFRYTITRSNGCDDIVLLYTYSFYENDANACANAEFTLDTDGSTNVPEGPPYTDRNFYLELDDDTLATLSAVTVDGSNILTVSYDMTDSDSIQDLEDAINAWLTANSSGTASIYVASNLTLIIVVDGVDSANEFQSITTNVATTNFTEL